jgi:hypothetical protein
VPLTSFNGGQLGRYMEGRTDLAAYPRSVREMRNFVPRSQGPVVRRPGTLHIADLGTDVVRLFPFRFSNTQSYLVIASPGEFRFLVDDEVYQVTPVSASISNGDFSSGLTGWTDAADTAGGTEGRTTPTVVTVGGETRARVEGFAHLTSAIYQDVAITETGTAHTIAFRVSRGTMGFRAADTSGNIWAEFKGLAPGWHRLSFTPDAATARISFFNDENEGQSKYGEVTDVSVLSSGDFTLPNPFQSIDEINDIQFVQIGDIIWMVHGSYPPHRVERRAVNSWSFVRFETSSQPLANFDPSDGVVSHVGTGSDRNRIGPCLITVSNADSIQPEDVGRSFEVTSPVQSYPYYVHRYPFKSKRRVAVTGDGANSRIVFYQVLSAQTGYVQGTGNCYIRISTEPDGDMSRELTVDVGATANTSTSSGMTQFQPSPQWCDIYADSDNGAVANAGRKLNITSLSGESTQRGVIFSSDGAGAVEVLMDESYVRGDDNSIEFRLGAWNSTSGYPTSVAFAFNRLWFGRGLTLWGSAVDDYTNFITGSNDSDAIEHTIAARQSDGIRWLAGTGDLLIGTGSFEFVGRGNDTGDPVTPATFRTFPRSSEGSTNIMPANAGDTILYVSGNLRRLYEFGFNPNAGSLGGYSSVNLSRLNEELFEDGIVDVQLAFNPERMAVVTLSSGNVRILIYRREEEILGWCEYELADPGRVLGAAVIPTPDADAVYLLVRRFVNGSVTYRIERWAELYETNPEESVHADAAVTIDVDKRDAVIYLSALTGTGITVASSDGVFVSGDVGKVIWARGGKATITAFTDSFSVTADVNFDFNDNEFAGGLWGVGTPITTVTGLDHLEGQQVAVWVDMQTQTSKTVSSGQITLDSAASVGTIGLPFTSSMHSLKLAYGAQRGTAQMQYKAIRRISIDLDQSQLPINISGGKQPGYDLRLNKVAPNYLTSVSSFSGEVYHKVESGFETDPRWRIDVTGPHPVTIVAMTLDIETRDSP